MAFTQVLGSGNVLASDAVKLSLDISGTTGQVDQPKITRPSLRWSRVDTWRASAAGVAVGQA
jgi:hypothetical protein